MSIAEPPARGLRMDRRRSSDKEPRSPPTGWDRSVSVEKVPELQHRLGHVQKRELSMGRSLLGPSWMRERPEGWVPHT